MKLLRISASVIAFSMLTALAACGGGGGGGGTTPPTNGGGPPPGGGTPTPHATATPTPTATATPTPPPITVSSTHYTAYDSTSNHSWGADNWQTNGVTDTGDKGDGDTSSGASGSNTIDGLSCSLPTGEQPGTFYHVHAFVGIYVNGTAYALPDAIGMKGPDDSQDPILNFTCAYTIHTHADSGIVHIEDPSISGTYQTVQPPSKYSLQTLMDIWGQSLSALPISGVAGVPAIYTGTPSGKDANGNDLVSSYSLSTASPSAILLKHHVAVWLIYGAPPVGGVPQIAFGISN